MPTATETKATKTKRAAATKAAPITPSPIAFSALPAIGAALAGGIYAGITNDAGGAYQAVVLLPDEPPKPLNWQAANTWAKKLGAGAQLPNRPIGALLFFNVRKHVEPDWYWTNEEHATLGSFAWSQNFISGDQYYDHKSDEGRARAVRLIPIGS